MFCLIVLALWASSYWRFMAAEHTTAHSYVLLRSYDGMLEGNYGNFPEKFSGFQCDLWGLMFGSIPMSRYDGVNYWRQLSHLDTPMRYVGVLYVDYDRHVSEGPGRRIRVLAVPYRLYAVIFGLLPAIWLVRRRGSRRRDRIRRGLCPACGYDLRSEPTGKAPLVGTCPECGLAAADERRRYAGRLSGLDGPCSR
jgi:hypothetical protein